MKKLCFLAGLLLLSSNSYADNLLDRFFNTDEVKAQKDSGKVSGSDIEALEQSCLKDNNSKACILAGNQFSDVNSEHKDYLKAKSVYEKGCSLSNGPSCLKLGQLYEKKLLEDKTGSNVVDAYTKGCSFNHAYSCYELGNVLKKGILAKKNESESQKAYKTSLDLASKGCDSDNGEDCFVKGNLYLY